jgi:PKD repeat protein
MKRGILTILGLSLLLTGGCGGDKTTTPQGPAITSITPSQVARGLMGVTGSIQGSNLNGATSVNLGSGITLEQFTPVSASQIDIRFSVSATAAAGTRTITVTTTAGTASNSSLLTVADNTAPVAKFKVTPSTGGRNTDFQFDATQSADPDGSISSYSWDFGDGRIDHGKTATHRYSGAGNYVVKLSITDNKSATAIASKTVTVVDGVAPVARFTVTPASGDIGTMLTFDGAASKDNDGSITAYAWRFGDGGSATGQIVQHAYKHSGTYHVRLTVTDNSALTSFFDKDVKISNYSEDQEKKVIGDVVEKFLRKYAKLETLPTDDILQNWSQSTDCPGREHERKIIEKQKADLKETDVRLLLEPDVYIHADHNVANADLTALFTWTTKTGESGSVVATHDFLMVKEEAEWMICNFHLIDNPEGVGATAYTISQ